MQRRIGERIRWARELIEPNQTEAAKILRIDPSTLNKIEMGTRAPSIFNVISLANRFRLTADYILRGDLTGVDQELALRLAALHPELVLEDRGMGHRGNPPGGGRHPEPRRQG